jgi:hypothetical protein
MTMMMTMERTMMLVSLSQDSQNEATVAFIATSMDFIHISRKHEEFGEVGIDALRSELQSMINKKVWRPVHKSTLSAAERRTILNYLAFLKQKYHPDGFPDQVKARLVAGGHMQDTASPNVFMETAICALRKWICATADIGSDLTRQIWTHFSRIVLQMWK